ncbi:MAG: hypothetical protein ACU85V_13620, partial [Gammaproteobacteria bacterium]
MISSRLRALLDAAAPLWAGEAEVVRSYFEWPRRTRETDMLWLRRQCRKEFWDSVHFVDDESGLVLGPLESLRAGLPRLERGFGRHEALDLAESLCDELRHYVLFADVYDLLRGPADPPLDVHAARTADEWPENRALGELRQAHRAAHGALAARVCRFTEGGYCTLYREGLKRAGKGPIDDALAHACRRVYDDEVDHMTKGIAGLDAAGLTAADWTLFTELTRAQLAARIHMRNAQFSHPLSAARIAEILDGAIAHYKRALAIDAREPGVTERLLDPRGQLRSFAVGGEPLPLGGGAGLMIHPDQPVSWDAWDVERYSLDLGRPAAEELGLQVTESGPLRA